MVCLLGRVQEDQRCKRQEEMAVRDKDIERRTKAERKGQQLNNLYHVVHFQ